MKKIFRIVCMFVIVFGLSACSEGGFLSDSNESIGKSREDYSKKVSVSSYELADGDIVAIIKNNSNKVLDIDAELSFYDEEGNLLNTESEYVSAQAPNSESAVKFYIFDEEKYDTYKIVLEAEESYYDSIDTSKFDIKHNNTGSRVTTQITNNSGNDNVDLDVNVLYFKDGKVIGCEGDSEFEVKNGKTVNMTFDYPKNKRYDDISFDEYKIYLQAMAE